METCDECGIGCSEPSQVHKKRDGAIANIVGPLMTCHACKKTKFCRRCKELRNDDLIEAFSIFMGPSLQWDRMSGEHYMAPGYHKDISAKAVGYYNKFNGCFRCSVESLNDDDFKRRLLGWRGGRIRLRGVGNQKQRDQVFSDLRALWSYQLDRLPNVKRVKVCRYCKTEYHLNNYHCDNPNCGSSQFIRPYKSSQNNTSGALRR